MAQYNADNFLPGTVSHMFDENANKVVETRAESNIRPELTDYSYIDYVNEGVRKYKDYQREQLGPIQKGLVVAGDDIIDAGLAVVDNINAFTEPMVLAINSVARDKEESMAFIENYLNSRANLLAFERSINPEDLQTSGAIARLFGNVGTVYPGVYSFARAKGVNKHLSNILAWYSDQAVFTKQAEGNLISMFDEMLSFEEPSMSKKIWDAGSSWAVSDKDESFLKKTLRDGTGNGVVIYGGVGLAYHSFMLMRSIAKNAAIRNPLLAGFLGIQAATDEEDTGEKE